MIKRIIPSCDEVIRDCISNTYEYLISNPEAWSKTKINWEINTNNVGEIINKFFDSTPGIGKPTTKPDELVSDILESWCGCDPDRRCLILKQYNLQKQVEQKIVGVLLEAYVLKYSYSHGWIQTGDCIRGTDMIKKESDGNWYKLQIKNSDNTPNSSSAGFVSNKALTWQRRNSRTGGNYWNEFPDDDVKLSEEGFREFIKEYYLIQHASNTD